MIFHSALAKRELWGVGARIAPRRQFRTEGLFPGARGVETARDTARLEVDAPCFWVERVPRGVLKNAPWASLRYGGGAQARVSSLSGVAL